MKNRIKNLSSITKLATVLFLLLAFAQLSKGELTELQRIFGVSGVRATYVVVVDTSSSMRPFWGEVKNALGIFINALPVGDHLSLIVFDNQATMLLSENIPQDKGSLLNVLPSDPGGKKTDIGRAIKKAIEELEKSRNKIGFLLFLTDGKDEPPPDSEFVSQHDTEWRILRERGGKLIGEKNIEIYAIGLKAGADIGKLGDVFGSEKVSLLTKSSSQLRSYFHSVKDELLRQKLLGQVEQELEEGYIDVILSESKYEKGELSGSFTISSFYRLLKVEANIEAIKVDKWDIPRGGKLQKEDITFSIRNGRVPLLLEPQGTSKPLTWAAHLKEVEHGFYFGLQPRVYKGEVKVIVSSVAQPADEIEEIGLEPKGGIKYQTIPVSFSPGVFIPIWGIGAGVVVILATLWVTVSVRRKRRRLFGWLTFSESPMGQKLPTPVRLADYFDEVIVGRAGQITLYGGNIAEKHARFFRDGKDMKIEPIGANQMRVNDKIASSVQNLSSGDNINIGGYIAMWAR